MEFEIFTKGQYRD